MASLFDKLASSTKQAPAKEKENRPQFPIPKEAEDALEQFAGAKTLENYVKSRMEVAEVDIKRVMLSWFAEALFETNSQPANPRVELTKDNKPYISALFQVQKRFNKNYKKGDEPVEERLVDSFAEAGLPRDIAKRLVEKEIDATPKLSLRSFNELVEGRYENSQFIPATKQEKQVADKLMTFVLSLTDEEKKLVVRNVEDVKLKDGFFERLKGYCRNVKDVMAVLRIFTPVHFMGQVKYGISDSPEAVVDRLLDVARSILTEVKEED